ncbi:MAG: PBP1A family penicillin-binding protein [Clostridium sp.]|nr:PBP1A family penicillin-binding protein [Clostridium sp.]MCM1444540.1 PBP1A family penicillin-binding protein [Candidatus Amulumruptor caecigallinarius]
MKIFKKIIFVFVIIFLILFLAYCGLYVYAKLTPKLSINSANNYYFYDINDNLYNGNNDNWVALSDISDNLKNATISIEDKHFYEHIGFDYLRILKSLYINFKNGANLQGASTITQQYAKNLFLTFDKTWERKIEEAWITIRLESHYSKDEILEGYLNTINYGGVFGIENASLYYFNKNSKDLTLAEAAILAGIPKSPANYNPISNYENAKNRQIVILNSMVKNKYITQEERDQAVNEELTFYGVNPMNNISSVMYYQDAVLQELQSIKTIPSSFLETGGLKIYTNLNMEYQQILGDSVTKNTENNKEIQVASVVMDPNTGKILALVGGKNYSKSQYNRATLSKRQVGSTMKPFLYYAALENGFTPSTTFTSEKTTFTFSYDKLYSPSNYGNLYADKPITMAAAIAYSDNIYAVKTHLFLGEETLVNMAKRIGIDEDLDAIPSLALGSQEINLIDMTEAYATFANEGYKVDGYLIEKVTDLEGNILYQHEEEKTNVLNKNLVYILNELLANTYSSSFNDYNYATMVNYKNKMTKKYAVKTGTTDYDRLIFGYNKDLVVGVWTGYDDNKETPSEDRKISQNIWLETIEGCLKDKEDNWYKMPSNVIGVLVDPISGKLAKEDSKNKAILYYIKGTEPNSSSTLDDSIPTIKTD